MLKTIEIDEQIFLLGDNHGDWSSVFYDIKNCDIKNASIIHVGDIGVGFCANGDDELVKFGDLNEKFKSNNITFYGIRGNHDNPMYFDGRIDMSNFKLLPDYSYIQHNSKLILLVGGAVSIDRTIRLDGVSYWSGEGFNLEEDMIKKCDVLITHTAPINHFGIKGGDIDHWLVKDIPLANDLLREQESCLKLINLCKPSKLYCGHFHVSVSKKCGDVDVKILDIDELIEFD